MLNSPVSLSKGNPILKTGLKLMTDVNMFEDTMAMIGGHIEDQARWVMPVDVTKSRPVENTELIQGPNSLYDTMKQEFNTLKGKVQNYINKTNSDD